MARDKDNFKLDNLLSSMNKSVVDTLTYKQKKELKKALNNQDWGKHSVDLRPTVAAPFIPWSFYFVFLAGVNKRRLTNTEKGMACIMFLLMIILFGFSLVCMALLLLYLIKSWLGIDIFPNDSIGVWDSFLSFTKTSLK